MVKNMGSVFNPYDEMLSNHFSLADMTITNTGIDNTPTDADKKNLRWTAGVLDKIYDQIGPFRIASAYRSEAVQNRLRELGYPTAEKKSFHEVGMGADIVPLNMDLNEFFNKLLAQFKDRLGEIALKDVEGQQAIHLSMPTATTIGKVLTLDDTGKYVAMAASEIEDRINSVIASIEEYGGQFISSASSMPFKKPLVFWGAIGLTIIGVFALMGSKPSRRTA